MERTIARRAVRAAGFSIVPLLFSVAFLSGCAGLVKSSDVVPNPKPTSTAATPVITPATGTFTTAQTVTIADTTAGATIFYTKDGTTPTVNSTMYTGSFSVSSTTTVEAIAVASGFTNSVVASSVITISAAAAATPVITPATGSYTAAQSVTITDATAGATIFYTKDGTTPTVNSTMYTGSFSVSATTTVKAIAGGAGFSSSSVTTSVITINVPVAAAPVITPATGTYTTAQTVTITDATAGATIFYTKDGTTPTVNSTMYTGSFSVSATTTVEAIAVASGFTNSTVATSVISISAAAAATPVITPATGSYTAAQSVTITDATPGATIYYTLNGSTPSTSSTIYTAAIPVSATTTVKAIAAGGGFANSGVATSVITINVPVAAAPVISPATGSYTGAQTVTITDTTAGATIFYTKDGTTPTVNSTPYTGSFSVSSTTTVEAIAVASGFTNSVVATSVITISAAAAATPVITPATGTYTAAQTVTITDATPGATIHYTLDGSTPSTSSAVYTAAIPVGATTTVKAIAAGGGFASSPVATSAITINLPVAATPVIAPAGGAYATAQTVTITDETPGAAIFYTSDGSTPTTGSAQYTAPILVSSSQTINALAAASGDANSSVATATYTIGATTATPTLVQFTAGSSTQNHLTGSYVLSFPNPTLSGNFLACGFSRLSGALTTSVSDDQGQTWTAGATNTDTVNGGVTGMYYFPNTVAGVRQVTIHFSADKTFVSAACWEFYNVAVTNPADTAGAGFSDLGTSSRTVTSGSFTTSTAGDLILMWVFRTGGNNTVWTQGAAPWKLNSADAQDGMASQYEIQSAAGAINPTMSSDVAVDWSAVGMAFKAASAGTAPAPGARVISILHHAINNTMLSYKNGIPTNGNLLVAAYVGQAGMDICPMTGGTGSCSGKPGVVDSNGNNWISSGPVLPAAGDSQQFYVCNANPGTTLTVTYNFTSPNNGTNVWFYDVAGAATNCFDKRATATGSQDTSVGDVTGASVTPAVANGILIGTLDVANFYVAGTETANCYFDSMVTIPNISGDPADQNNGAMHCYPPNTSTVTTHWTSAGGPLSVWGSYLVSYNPN